MSKPDCYSPGKTKSYAEMAENDCFTCPERETCLSFAGDILQMARRLPPFPSTRQILTLANDTGLAHEDIYGTVFSPYDEGTDIRDIVVDFAIKLLNKYGNFS